MVFKTGDPTTLNSSQDINLNIKINLIILKNIYTPTTL